MKHILTFILFASLLFSNEEINFDDTFLDSLDEVSEIATKTKLNIDDSPSFVTVLHGEKLQALGIENVFEALTQVPGVQLSREASGVPVVIFRGVSQKGEVKLMIDGITINNSYRGSIYHYLDFPIEMIDRIEVIRGAGSVLYGSGAISGVINIFTKSAEKNSKDMIALSGGTYDYYKGAAIVNTEINDFSLTLDGYYQKNEKMLDDTDRHLKDFSVGANIQNKNFEFIARVKQSQAGNAYGVLGVPDRDKNKFYNFNSTFLTQLSYQNDLNRENYLKVSAGYSYYAQNIQTYYPGRAVPLILPTAVTSKYEEDSYYAQADLHSKSVKNNELLIGTKYESTKTLNSQWSEEIPSPYLPKYTSDPDAKRDIFSLYVNDKYAINSDFELSAGLRYDNYSDFGDSFSPTLGLVYRLTEKLRLKTLYSSSFRAPSWVELTSRANTSITLDAENSNSIEAGIIFKQNQNNILRVNFYTTEVLNMITKNSAGKYIQNLHNTFYGAEAEYLYSFNYQTEFNFIASYVDARDNNNEALADIANIVASTSLIYETTSGIRFGSLLKYVSSSKRAQTDTRAEVPYSLIFDETISYKHKDLTLALVLKDLFDKEIYYALPANALGNDFYDGGRGFIVKASMEF